MNSRKNRFISGFLSFVMMFMLVMQVLPPIKVSAASKPTVETLEATDITETSAVLNGKVKTNGGVLIEEYGFGYSINGGSWKYPWSESGHIASGEIVSYELEGLKPGVIVQYYFYAINSVGESSPNYVNFETTSEDTEPPLIDPIKSSKGTSFSCDESTTFSTNVSDDTELDEIIMYIDGDEVKSVTASGTDASISYKAYDLEPGEHEILVEAYDAAGNDNYTDITVEVLLSRPEITAPDTHTWPSNEDLTIKWDSVSGASYYLVTVTDNDINNNTVYIYDEKKVSSSSRKITVYSDDLYGEHYLEVYIVAYSSDGIESPIGSKTIYVEPTAIIVDPDAIGFSAAGGTYDINVYCDSDWEIENLSSYSWISASRSSGSGDKTITLTIKKNTTAYQRAAALKFTDDYETVSLAVVQAGVEQYLEVSDEAITVSYQSGNSKAIDIESNIEWTLAEDSDWFSLSCRDGEGDGSFYFIVEENPTQESRTDSAWIHNSVDIVEIEITQEGNPNISLDPQVNSITSSMNPVSVGKEFSITITTNSSTAGIQLFVKESGDKHNLGSTTAVNSQTSTTKSFVLKYTFNSTGLIEDGIYVTNTRRIYAYPIDANGNVIEDDSVGSYYDITVTPADYTLGDFTAYDTEVELGENATISWSAASAETNDTVYYNVYIGTKTSNILLTPNKTSARSITVDSSLLKEIGAGTYAVMVIATAANHGQKQVTANITITASSVSTDITKPVINPISSSADPIIYGTSVTFSTAASDETALDKVEMYMDGSLVRTVSAADTYANISYTTSSISEGTHTVLVKAYDDAGNYNSWSQSFTVKKISSGIVHSVELSDYDFYAGSYITFTVKTSKDTSKIRLVDGSYAFSVQSSGYKDSGDYRIWTFEQYVGTVGTNRKLKVESYSGGWTGNYSETAPFTVRKNIVDVGDFEIVSPASGTKHQINASLTVTWSEPYIEPDWYVVNVSGVPSGSDLISVNGNTAVIDKSAFDEYGTYAISVTAQKEGYNQSEAYVNVTVGCLHEDRTQVGVKYGLETYYSDSKHKVTVTPKYLCNTCGGTFTDTSEAYTEYSEHNHDVELDNNGWFCDCGYVDSGSYTPWTGYLQSNSKEKAYNRVMSDGELTNWDGVSKVYPEDTITVVGTKFDAFLIQYSLDSGGTKTRFVDRTLVDRMEYTGRSIVYVSIDGIDLRCIQEGNGTLYASAYDLATVLNGSCSFISNNKLYCRMKVYDSVSALNYYWEADLRNYNARSNWQNLNAYTDESLTTLAKSAFAGAYVYCGEINISIKGVLELLSYESVGENAYSKKNIDYDLIKTAQSIRDTSGQFNRVCNLLTGEFSTYLYSIAKFDAEGLINKIADNVAFSSTDTIEAVKQSLLTNRSDEEAIEAFEVVKMFFGIAEKTSNGMEWFVTASCADLEKELEEFDDMMEPINGWFDKINLSFSLIDFTKCTIDHLYTAGLLAQNFDSNMEYLNILIANCESEYMKKVYVKVRDELELYYYNTVLGYFNSIGHNQAVHGALFDYYIDVVSAVADTSVTDVLEKKLGPTNGYLLAHAAVSAVADNVFKGEDLYSAASKLYIAADVLPEMIEEVNNAISIYRMNPSESNRRNVVLTAKNLANYRIFALTECKKYEDSLVIANFFFNDEYQVNIKNIENEKAKIENLMDSLN